MSALRLTLRLDAHDAPLLGHGKVRLLEQLRETGSISAAARAMGMSYRRAWLLVEAMNVQFSQPLVATRAGGGGGAALTETGERIVAAYRQLELTVQTQAASTLAEIEAMLSPSK